MEISNQRLQFLKVYRAHLRGELDQMEYGQMPQVAVREVSNPPDHLSNVLAIAAMILIFASIFMVQ